MRKRNHCENIRIVFAVKWSSLPRPTMAEDISNETPRQSRTYELLLGSVPTWKCDLIERTQCSTKSLQSRVTVSVLRFPEKNWKKRILEATAEQTHHNQQPWVCNGIAQVTKLKRGITEEEVDDASSGLPYRRPGCRGTYWHQLCWSWQHTGR